MCVFFLAGQATCLRLKSPPRSHFSLEVAAFGITGHSSSAPLGGLWALFPALVEGFAGFFRTALKQNKGKQQTIFCSRRESIGYLETEKNKLRICARPYVGGFVTSHSTLLPSKNTFETDWSSVRRLVWGGKFQNLLSSPPCVPDGSIYDGVAEWQIVWVRTFWVVTKIRQTQEKPKTNCR